MARHPGTPTPRADGVPALARGAAGSRLGDRRPAPPGHARCGIAPVTRRTGIAAHVDLRSVRWARRSSSSATLDPAPSEGHDLPTQDPEEPILDGAIRRIDTTDAQAMLSVSA